MTPSAEEAAREFFGCQHLGEGIAHTPECAKGSGRVVFRCNLLAALILSREAAVIEEAADIRVTMPTYLDGEEEREAYAALVRYRKALRALVAERRKS